MIKRVIVGVGLLVSFLVIVLIDFKWLNFFLIGAVLLVAFCESLTLFAIQKFKSLSFVALGFYALIPFWQTPNASLKAALLALSVVAGVVAFLKFEKPQILLPFIYPTLPIFLLLGVYLSFNIAYLCFIILTVVVSDSAAYFGGKFFGKRFFKFDFSKSSPNKSYEGSLIALAAGTFFGTLYAVFLMDENILKAMFCAFLIVLFGNFGDLFESYLKRRVGVKDSGKILGEQGGILDRIDGYLFAVVAFWLVFGGEKLSNSNLNVFAF